MSEFWQSVGKWFNEKTSSPLYSTYLGFFVAWNWRFFQIIFLESEKLFSAPRIEYIQTNLYHHFGMNPVLDWLVAMTWKVAPPALLTYWAIIYLPRLQKWAFDIYLGNRFDRMQMFQDKQHAYDLWLLDLEKKKTQTTRSIATEKKAQVEQKKEIEKTKTQEEKWQEEFEQIKRQDLLHGFQGLVGVLYKSGGIMYAHQVEDALGHSSGIVAFAGTHNLIDSEREDGGSTMIRLTDKGKHFSRLLANKGIVAQ